MRCAKGPFARPETPRRQHSGREGAGCGTFRGDVSQGPERMMNLIVDIGNSRLKAVLMDDGVVARRWVAEACGVEQLEELLVACPRVERAIVASTCAVDPAYAACLRRRADFVVDFDNRTPIPLRNGYGSPATLGADRLAAAVGGVTLWPGRNLFIVDFGSAITLDVVTADGVYRGGSISPGLAMRFRALHDYTGRLPLIGIEEYRNYREGMVPATTREAMAVGVIEGIVAEVGEWMRRYGRNHAGLVTIFTGGDAAFFEKRFKSTIFANHDLVLTGLNTILNYNAEQKNRL